MPKKKPVSLKPKIVTSREHHMETRSNNTMTKLPSYKYNKAYAFTALRVSDAGFDHGNFIQILTFYIENMLKTIDFSNLEYYGIIKDRSKIFYFI